MVFHRPFCGRYVSICQWYLSTATRQWVTTRCRLSLFMVHENGYWRSILRRRRWWLFVENERLHSPFLFFVNGKPQCSTGSHAQTPRTHHRTHSLVDSSSYLGLLKSSGEDRTTTPFQKTPFQFINAILVHDIDPANPWVYTSSAWCSLSQKDNEQLERAQRRAASYRLIVLWYYRPPHSTQVNKVNSTFLEEEGRREESKESSRNNLKEEQDRRKQRSKEEGIRKRDKLRLSESNL